MIRKNFSIYNAHALSISWDGGKGEMERSMLLLWLLALSVCSVAAYPTTCNPDSSRTDCGMSLRKRYVTLDIRCVVLLTVTQYSIWSSGYLGIDEAECEGKGCCWSPTNVSIYQRSEWTNRNVTFRRRMSRGVSIAVVRHRHRMELATWMDCVTTAVIIWKPCCVCVMWSYDPIIILRLCGNWSDWVWDKGMLLEPKTGTYANHYSLIFPQSSIIYSLLSREMLGASTEPPVMDTLLAVSLKPPLDIR